MATHDFAPAGQLSQTVDPEPPAGRMHGEQPEVEDTAGDEVDHSTTTRRRFSPSRSALLLGLVTVIALGCLAGWLGLRAYHAREAAEQRAVFVAAAQQSAVNLTTIDWQHADADIQRILDAATGTFYDDFSQRSKPFVDVVKQVQSKSVGTVTEAALESVSGTQAQVLVALSVKTTNAGTPEQDPRSWRMRIAVQKVGDQAKVANVTFVP